jgi:hypothetical protein
VLNFLSTQFQFGTPKTKSFANTVMGNYITRRMYGQQFASGVEVSYNVDLRQFYGTIICLRIFKLWGLKGIRQ